MMIFKLEKPIFSFAVDTKLNSLCKEYNKLNKEKLLPQDFLPSKKSELATGYDVRCLNVESFGNYNQIYKIDDYTWSIEPFANLKIDLGIRMFAPENWWLALCGRSGMFCKSNFMCLDGMIDEDFQGNLCLLGRYVPDEHEHRHIHNISSSFENYSSSERLEISNEVDNSLMGKQLILTFGQRIGQVYPVPRYDMEIKFLKEKEFQEKCQSRDAKRGDGGFGSSGTK